MNCLQKVSLSNLVSSFFFHLLALALNNLQTNKSFINSLIKSSLWLCFPEYNQQEREVFVEHSSFLLPLSSMVEGEMLFSVLSAFLHF